MHCCVTLMQLRTTDQHADGSGPMKNLILLISILDFILIDNAWLSTRLSLSHTKSRGDNGLTTGHRSFSNFSLRGRNA